MYCRLHAFWEDQTDPKFVCGGPNTILRMGRDAACHCHESISEVFNSPPFVAFKPLAILQFPICTLQYLIDDTFTENK